MAATSEPEAGFGLAAHPAGRRAPMTPSYAVMCLEDFFSLQDKRDLSCNLTFLYNDTVYAIESTEAKLKNKAVTIWEELDGTIRARQLEVSRNRESEKRICVGIIFSTYATMVLSPWRHFF